MKRRLTDYFGQIYRPGAKYSRFLVTLLLSGIAYGLYRGVQDNYLAQIVHISEFERGIVEFFRELPGLLVVLILAVMHRMSASKIFKIGTAIMLAGMVGLTIAGTDKVIVILFMVVFSLGEHMIMPVKSTINLDLARKETGGAALGIAGSLTQIGSIAGLVVVTGLFAAFSRFAGEFEAVVPFKIVLAISCAFMVGAVLISQSMQETEQNRAIKRFYFAKKFRKFYMLEIFYGARKQVFLTFAPYALILHYGADTSQIALLLAICAVCDAIASPLIGKLIDKLGYKVIMVSDTLILVFVCFFYGFSHLLFSPNVAFVVVCVNYVLDSIISQASMASNVYVRDIADSSEEVVATLSTGVSVNHVISIFIALVGGYIWARVGIEVLFSLSAVLGIANSIYAATIKPVRH
ncbi:MFS transporter [Eubacteriales bacterium OttesenSCG-928-N13]|nr:MFS transporter [Eubacteriales bacterium OttesenSCG-928-N13]